MIESAKHKTACRVTARTENDQVVKREGVHSHLPDVTKIRENYCLQTAKEANSQRLKRIKRMCAEAFAELLTGQICES